MSGSVRLHAWQPAARRSVARGKVEEVRRHIATDVELDPDTDTAVVARGIVAVTPIVGIRAAGETDVAAFLEKELARPGQDWPGGLAASGS